MASWSSGRGAAAPTSIRSASRRAAPQQPGMDLVVVDDHVRRFQAPQAADGDRAGIARARRRRCRRKACSCTRLTRVPRYWRRCRGRRGCPSPRRRRAPRRAADRAPPGRPPPRRRRHGRPAGHRARRPRRASAALSPRAARSHRAAAGSRRRARTTTRALGRQRRRRCRVVPPPPAPRASAHRRRADLNRDDPLARRRHAHLDGQRDEMRSAEPEAPQAGRRQDERVVARRRPACAAACRRCPGSATNVAPGRSGRQLRDAADAAGADRAPCAEPRPAPPRNRIAGAAPAAPARRADPRAAATAAISRPSGSTAGMSFALWTATSIVAAEQRVLDLLDEQPLAAGLRRAARAAADRRRS